VLVKARAIEHAAHHPVAALLLELVERYAALRRDVDDGIAVAIRQALTDGASWPQIAKVMAASQSTLKGTYSAEKVDKALIRRDQRRPACSRTPAAPNTKGPPTAAVPGTDRSHPVSPATLSHASCRTCAAATGSGPSPTWRSTQACPRRTSTGS
jgi:hypothetical protein